MNKHTILQAARDRSARGDPAGRAGAQGRRHAAQRVLRPDARVVRRLQQGLRQVLGGEDGPEDLGAAVARRLGQAGAHRDRRPAGRRGHAGTGRRHRRARDAGQAAAGQLAGTAAAQQRALHVDDRVPGAQGQSEGHQGLGRPRKARRVGDHAEPEDLGRRALELPRGLGLGAEAAGWQRGHGHRVHAQAVARPCRCSTPARAAR